MHNLLHLLCRLPNGANIHDCRPSEVGTGKTLHGRRHGGREHDSLVEKVGGEGQGEGRRWEKKGREERGVVGEGGGGGKERGKGGEKGGGREGKRKGGKGEGRGGEGRRGEGRKREREGVGYRV